MRRHAIGREDLLANAVDIRNSSVQRLPSAVQSGLARVRNIFPNG